MMLQNKKEDYRAWPEAAIETTVQVVGGKWKGIILNHLIGGELRFNQIRRVIPDITQRMLTLQLRELERSGVVRRRVYSGMPMRVGYSLSDLGKTLIPLLQAMQEWGESYLTSAADIDSD